MDKKLPKFHSNLEIISVHVVKTAGSTLGNILKQIYGSSYLNDYTNKELRELISLGILNSETRAVHGHFHASKYKDVRGSQCKQIVWVRNPVIRIISLYYFWLGTAEKATQKLHKEMVEKNMSLAEFVEKNEVRNQMYREFFSGVSLSDFTYIGIQELFVDELQKMKNLNIIDTSKIKDINLNNYAVNKNPYKGYDYNLIRSIMEKRDLVSHIAILNHKDMEIYRKALAIRAKQRGKESDLALIEPEIALSYFQGEPASVKNFYEVLHKSKFLEIESGFPKTDVSALELLVKKAGRDKMRVLQIGSFKGYTTAVLAKNIAEYKGTLYVVDDWQGKPETDELKEASEKNVFNIFQQNLMRLGLWEIVHPMLMKSEPAAKRFAENSLDLIFIDGDHRYSGIANDVKHWLPKLKFGGIICGNACNGYYSQFSEQIKEIIDLNLEENHVSIPEYGIGIHPGVSKALYDLFKDRHKIIPNSVQWYYQKASAQSQLTLGKNSFQRANQLKKQGKVQQAILIYRNLIENSPNFSWYHYELGDALVQAGQLDEAIAAYHFAVELNPNSTTFLIGLGDALSQQNSEQALISYQEAIKLKPDLSALRKKVDFLLKKLELERSLKYVICCASSTMKEVHGPQNLFWGEQMIWHSQRPPQYPEWLEFELLEPQKWEGISIKPQQGHYERSPSTFRMMGSNDTQEWEPLLSVSDYKWASNNWQQWNFERSDEYKYYKMEIWANNGHPDLLTIERLAPIIDNANIKPI